MQLLLKLSPNNKSSLNFKNSSMPSFFVNGLERITQRVSHFLSLNNAGHFSPVNEVKLFVEL
jgi:hypothetical protein